MHPMREMDAQLRADAVRHGYQVADEWTPEPELEEDSLMDYAASLIRVDWEMVKLEKGDM